MIDTHAHIDGIAFDEDRAKVIEEAFSSGIEAIVIPAIEPKDFRRLFHAVDLSPKIYCGLGVHPHNASEATDEILDYIEIEAQKNKKVIAIGETGLDYYYDFNPPEIQKKSFRRHIEISKKIGLPLIVHNRESDDDLINILEEYQDGTLEAVLHCFSSDKKMLEKALSLGFHISYTGNITFKKSSLAEIVDSTPMDRIMIETDSPYMTPAPYRGKRNNPSNVRLVAEKIAEIKNLSIVEVIEMTTNNAKRFFKLGIVVIILGLFPFILSSQTEAMFQEEEENIEEVEEIFSNPFKKGFGFFPAIGTNTIVETFYPGDDDNSYEGILAVGGGLNYFLNDNFAIQTSYLYSKDSKKSDLADPSWGLKPSIYHNFEVSLLAHVVPWQKINFYGIIGGTLINSQIGTGSNEVDINYNTGINTGVGILVNFNLGKGGMLTASFEWKIDFILDRSEYDHDPRAKGDPNHKDYNNKVESSNFFSIPRAYFTWYPKF